MGGMTGATGKLLVRFSTGFHNPRSRPCTRRCVRPGRVGAGPEAPLEGPGKLPESVLIRGTGAEVCENESRKAQVLGIHRRQSRWDAIATEHPGAAEPGAGGANGNDA